MMPINTFWACTDAAEWSAALERYWTFVKPENEALERTLDSLSLDRLARMNELEWYSFLRDEYFRWKYTAPNRYTTTTSKLQHYVNADALGELDQIRKRLLKNPPGDIRLGLETAYEIHGLGPAGASGLLALMYPEKFGTADQFVVRALRDIDNLSEEAPRLKRMNPESLTISDAVIVVKILQRKAADNNRVFETDTWTPRKVDKVLWAFRQRSSCR